MDNVNDNIVIKSNNRYKGAPEVSYQVPTTLEQNTSLLIETDRSFNLNLSDLFDQERQKSTIFRPTFKVDFLFENNYSGTTDYNPFSYNLYILDGEKSLAQKIAGTTITWYGIPQTYEFDLIRLDSYNTHIGYRAESATTYNWDYYLTYPFSADTNFNMRWYQNDNGNLLANFLSSEGIPALLSGVTINGANYLQFTCPVKHGLSVGEYVKFPFSYNGTSFFEVNLLGNETYGSDEYVFNLYNPGYTGTTFKSGYVYIFKRTIDITNTADTTSRYYIRMNKVVSKTTDLQIETAAFDANAFNNPTKYEFSSLTPNNISSVSRLTNSQAYSITNQKDLNISGVVDENQRPIDFLYLTFVYKGYAGWFMNEKYGLKRGWEFNMNEPVISPWWDFNQPLSNETSITKTSYSKAQLTKIYNFYYNETLNTGDTIYGDWYEYNDYEQLGRVISPYYHKFVFNQKNFNIGVGNTNPTGYYYQVHHPMRIKSYSGYIEEGEPQSVLDIPTYSYFSQNLNMFRWRDLYPYGYIDVDGNGVDYPFVNQTQYPYTNIQFRLIPEGAKLGLTQSTFIPRPLVDECE